MRSDKTTFTCDRCGQTVTFDDPLNNDDEMQGELVRRGWRAVSYGTPTIDGLDLDVRVLRPMLLCRDCAKDIGEILSTDTYYLWIRQLDPNETVSQSNESKV